MTPQLGGAAAVLESVSFSHCIRVTAVSPWQSVVMPCPAVWWPHKVHQACLAGPMHCRREKGAVGSFALMGGREGRRRLQCGQSWTPWWAWRRV